VGTIVIFPLPCGVGAWIYYSFVCFLNINVFLHLCVRDRHLPGLWFSIRTVKLFIMYYYYYYYYYYSCSTLFTSCSFSRPAKLSIISRHGHRRYES